MSQSRALLAALILSALVAAGLAPGASADVRVGPNYRLNNDPSAFRGKDQVALAVDPSNPNHIVETQANYLTETCEASASLDGGTTWSTAVPLTAPAPPAGQQAFKPTCRISNHLGETMFQTVAFGSGENVYATSITPRYGPSGPPSEQAASLLVYKSIDGGVTWSPGVVSMAGGATSAAGPYFELPTLTVDPGAGTGGADRVISVAHQTTGFGNSAGCPQSSCPSVYVAVSNDGGLTFNGGVQASPAGVPIAGPDSASQPVINPDHSVSVAWRTQGATGFIQIARSMDGGVTWGTPVNVTGVTAWGLTTTSHVTASSPLPAGSSFPRLAVDHNNGNLYMVYNQGPSNENNNGPSGLTPPPGGYQGADHFINEDSHVYFQRSLDHGATWSTPKPIDDITAYPGAPVVQTRHPNVSVAPNGRIDIVWEDRRHWYQGSGEHDCLHTHLACTDARLGDTYYSYSTDGGLTFSRNIRISDRSHNNDVGYDYRFGTGWAFGPQSVALGNNTVLVAWMDSRAGSFDNDNQDIYLAKVDLNASGPIPQQPINQTDPVSLSVALSNFAYPGGGESLLAGTFATRNGTHVVIVNQNNIPDALAASVLARANLATVLLSPSTGLPATVKAEITRLAPAGAYVIGNDLSSQVITDLTSLGIDPTQITGISGADDPTTAAMIASQMDMRSASEKAAGTPAFDAAVIVDPASPDAVAASALAAARRLPILFVDQNSIPAATSAALSSLNITTTLVIGGPQWISDTVLGALPGAKRLGGADQFATSKAAVAESMARGLPDNIVYVADGSRPMDAALLGAAVGRTTGVMLLSPGPVDITAAGTVSSAGLTGVDRIVTVEPPPATPTPTPTPQPIVTPTSLTLSAASLTHKVFRVGSPATAVTAKKSKKKRAPIGTTLKFTLSSAAKVKIVISELTTGRRSGKKCVKATHALRHHARCTLAVTKGTLVRTHAITGANAVPFSGRIGKGALQPGRYEATLSATDSSGRDSNVVHLSFKIVRQRE